MSTPISFTKGHGTGNDFVIVPDADGDLDLSDDQVAALCDRRFGVGADGLLRVVRAAAIPEGAAATAAGVEWFMDYRNADGSAAEMCGNGIRVFVRYLTAVGWADAAAGPVLVGTRAGIKPVTVHERGFEVDLGAFQIDEAEVLVRARHLDVARPGIGVDVGNPHVVVALPTADELAGIDLTRVPQLEPAPVAGANVEFVVPNDPLVQGGTGGLRMRVFERGVGETLSCGTGVAAAALAVRHWAGAAAPDTWQVGVPGGELGVRVASVDGVSHVFLAGPATLVFSGEMALA